MIDSQESEYKPRHMKEPATEVTLAELRKLVDQLPDGTVYSIDLEVVSDGQEKK